MRDTRRGVVVRSPEKGNYILDQSLTWYLFRRLRKRLPEIGCHVWMNDVIAGTSVHFDEVEEQSKRVASALHKLGFRRGHVLYYVTYEMAQLYVVLLAVWRLGGAVRGCYQNEELGEYARQMRESYVKFVLVDAETAPRLREAIARLEWPVKLVSVGTALVHGATSFADMLTDNGQACRDDVYVEPREDVLVILSTSGSTGPPKGVMHTHFTCMAALGMSQYVFPSMGSVLTSMLNYSIGNFVLFLHSLVKGITVHHISKFNKEKYCGLLRKLKPSSIVVYPYVAAWLARSPELERMDVSFIKSVLIGGWVLDPATARLLYDSLPAAKLVQVYGMTEVMFVTSTLLGENHDSCMGPFALTKHEGKKFVTSGKLLPYVKAKIIDTQTGEMLSRGQHGEICVLSPTLMKGYLTNRNTRGRCANVDDDGWLRTGDYGFFDDNDNLYIIERLSFVFKYLCFFVCPSDIEAVLQEHPSVQQAGVVGIPNPETYSLARAFVVVRPGHHVFSWQLQKYVQQRLPSFKHLHGGVRFVHSLPVNRGGKLDRNALKLLAVKMETPGYKKLVIRDE